MYQEFRQLFRREFILNTWSLSQFNFTNFLSILATYIVLAL